MSSQNSIHGLDKVMIDIDLSKITIGIVQSEWNHDITAPLLDGCVKKLMELGIDQDQISKYVVPGAYELPLGARWLLDQENVDAIICLGCVIQGATKHDDYINQTVSRAIMNLSLMSKKPVIFGLLTTNTHAQAKERAGGDVGHKGEEAAISALQMLQLKSKIKKDKPSIGFK